VALNHSESLSGRISLRTSLGYALQKFCEEVFSSGGISFQPNFAYAEGVIRPDLVTGTPPAHSFHVTCTQGYDSLVMKKWRYAAEVSQVVAFFKGKCHTVNIMFGPLDELTAGDTNFLDGLFDSTIRIEELEGGTAIFENIVEGINDGVSINKIVLTAQKSSNGLLLQKQLLHKVQTIVNEQVGSSWDRQLVHKASTFINVGESPNKGFIPPPQVAWKRSMLRALCVNQRLWKIIFELENIPVTFQTYLEKRKIIKVKVGIVSSCEYTNEWKRTVKNGLSLKHLQILGERVTKDPRRAGEILDLWDNGERAQTVAKEFIHTLSQGKEAFIEYLTDSLVNGGSILLRQHRAHAWDLLINVLHLSQNALQQALPAISFGFTNPLQNLIPRTQVAVNTLQKVPELAESISRLVVDTFWDNLTNSNISERSLQERYIEYRIYCITKGSSIDPAEEILSSVTGDSHITKTSEERQTVTGGFLNRFTTVFHFSGRTSNDKLVLIKFLFGDSGSGHKSEEMAGRMSMIRIFHPEADNIFSIFIMDGYWKSREIITLKNSGWNVVCSLAEVEDILTEIS